MNEKQKPRQAATVILLRRPHQGGIEVLLTRRPEKMAFLGGMYCFPGGTVRKEDVSPAALRRCHGVSPATARKIVGSHFSPREALGLWVAAIRELFEEVGVLLAVKDNGEPAVPAANLYSRFTKRDQPGAPESTFISFLETENLRYDASQLVYFSHWQTPAQFKMRFDTRFYLGALPEGQQPLSSSAEVSQSIWLSPDRALNMFTQNNFPMIFPTFASLRTLADFNSLEAVFAEFRTPALTSDDGAPAGALRG